MPRLKRHEGKYDKLIRLISGYLTQNGTTIANAMGASYKTAKARMDNPEKFTLGELSTIMRSQGIPIEEMREAIPY